MCLSLWFSAGTRFGSAPNGFVALLSQPGIPSSAKPNISSASTPNTTDLWLCPATPLPSAYSTISPQPISSLLLLLKSTQSLSVFCFLLPKLLPDSATFRVLSSKLDSSLWALRFVPPEASLLFRSWFWIGRSPCSASCPTVRCGLSDLLPQTRPLFG